MNELMNCPVCGNLFIKTPVQDLCKNCYEIEEQAFQKVSNFLRERKNRMATMLQVVEKTGVDQDLIIKFIRKGRIQLVQFPNLQYPCERCGAPIQKGTICENCIKELKQDLEIFEKEQARSQLEKQKTYYVFDKPNGKKP